MPTNIKVDRLLLIKGLEAEQKKLTVQYKAEMQRFREAEKAYPAKLAKALETVAKAVRKPGAVIRADTYGGKPIIEGLPKKPLKPTGDKGQLCTLERQIATLRMSTQDTITVNEQSEYMKFVCSM